MAQSYPTERKVAASTSAAAVAAFIVGWIVTAVPGLSGLAAPLQALIVAAITGALAWVAGWMAKHSPRTPAASGSESYRPGGPI